MGSSTLYILDMNMFIAQPQARASVLIDTLPITTYQLFSSDQDLLLMVQYDCHDQYQGRHSERRCIRTTLPSAAQLRQASEMRLFRLLRVVGECCPIARSLGSHISSAGQDPRDALLTLAFQHSPTSLLRLARRHGARGVYG